MGPAELAAIGTLLSWLKDAGVLGATVLFIKMLLKGEIITKREHDDMTTDRNFWRDEFFKLLPTTRDAVQVAKTTAEKATGRRS